VNGRASDDGQPAARSGERAARAVEDDADPAAEREVEDDGSVPDKQIQRWKNEGGA
jgi:hypothetical protein